MTAKRRRTERLAFRLDDITADMDWEKFERVRALFDRYQVRPLLGVVPCNQDPKLKRGAERADFYDCLKTLRASGWTIAQHGYQHRYETASSGMLGLKKASEFAGLSLERQREKLKKGKAILRRHGLETDIFMAPGHTYDARTLQALKETGFRYVTDGYADWSYRRKGLIFLPCRSSHFVRVRGMDTICLHTNEMQEEDFAELERTLRGQDRIIVDFAQLLRERPHPFGAGVWMRERRNLLRKKGKRFLGGNVAVQAYLQRTDAPDPAQKRKNRLLGLPRFVRELFFPNGDTTCM